MNVETVKANLKRTIEGKKEALKVFEMRKDSVNLESRGIIVASIEFLKLNIAELERILVDLQNCNSL